MVNVTIQKLIYPAYQAVSGRHIISHWKEFERNQWLTPQEINALQTHLLGKMLLHAYQHVSFYRGRLDSAGYDPEHNTDVATFQNLPLLTKDEILNFREQLIADNFPSRMLKSNASGGSTGHTLSFVNDRPSLDVRSAITIRGDRWAGLEIGTPHARLWGAPLDISKQQMIWNLLTNRLLNRLWLDCFQLTDSLMAQYTRKLQKFNPQVLMGYASALNTFARYLQANTIPELHLKGIISSAETLFDEQRQTIESIFRSKVYNRYGCREAGPLACECPQGKIHVNADFIVLEVLKNDRPALPGETGEIVITPLFGYGMPLIRYSIGDLAVAAGDEPCSCGRGLPLIERIIGRTSDMMVNARGELFHGEYFTHLFYHQPGVRQFQVIQPDRDHLQFKLVTEPAFDIHITRDLEEKIHAFVGPMIISWEKVKDIPPLASGKRAFTISLVK